MGVPGSDLLSDAFECIDTIEVLIHKQGPRVKNRVGQWVTDYSSAPEVYQGSVQAVDRNVYLELGLDFAKTYVNIYLSANVAELKRNATGDKVTVGSKNYEVVSSLDWFDLDGWVGLLCVELIQPL